ncbi:MAG: methionyl-tRNA formyltransferase [Burkholderiales bacterium]|nr:methionyl-tRNA formyltransferase [Opitutaceae bacterium]
MPLPRTVFLGSDAISLPLLDWLVGPVGSSLVELTAIYTQPDRPVGRGQKIQANAIKQWALARGLPVHQPEKITPEVRAAYAASAPDLALVMAYGHILRDDFIGVPPLGTLNFHASLLPKYRGASPIQTSVACGEPETGVSLMRIVRQLDAGPVADSEAVRVESTDTALEIEQRLAAACAPLLARALPRLLAGGLPFVEQDHPAATFCRKLTKEDAALDFTVSASALAARINGLNPWPAAQVEWGGEPLKFGLADAVSVPEGGACGTPGEVVGADGEGLLIGTGEGVLRVRRLQKPGGKLLAAAEFLRGSPIAAGTVFASRPMAPLVGTVPFPVVRKTV